MTFFKATLQPFAEELQRYVTPVFLEELARGIGFIKVDEKRVLLKEASQYVVLCLSTRIQPKRGLQNKEINKITKGNLLEGLKELERTILSINIEGETFCSNFFIQTQKLRREFLIDAFIQTLETITMNKEDYNLLFKPEFIDLLLESQQRTNRVSIKTYKMIKESPSSPVDSLEFIKDYSSQFLMKEERMISASMKD